MLKLIQWQRAYGGFMTMFIIKPLGITSNKVRNMNIWGTSIMVQLEPLWVSLKKYYYVWQDGHKYVLVHQSRNGDLIGSGHPMEMTHKTNRLLKTE